MQSGVGGMICDHPTALWIPWNRCSMLLRRILWVRDAAMGVSLMQLWTYPRSRGGHLRRRGGRIADAAAAYSRCCGVHIPCVAVMPPSGRGRLA